MEPAMSDRVQGGSRMALRLHHGPQRQLLQVHELRQHEWVLVKYIFNYRFLP